MKASKLLALCVPFSLVVGCGDTDVDDGDDKDELVLKFPDSAVEVALRDDGSYTITFDDKRQIERMGQFELQLARQTFDPTVADPVRVPGLDDRPLHQLVTTAQRLYLVQFVTQPLEEYRLRIRELGGTAHQYFPSQAHLVRMDDKVA
ncbi:MAG TPA: hypothetical protein VIU61_30790, partial [Kofleriaceae bacterium]